jgi:hypothetical protein
LRAELREAGDGVASVIRVAMLGAVPRVIEQSLAGGAIA